MCVKRFVWRRITIRRCMRPVQLPPTMPYEADHDHRGPIQEGESCRNRPVAKFRNRGRLTPIVASDACTQHTNYACDALRGLPRPPGHTLGILMLAASHGTPVTTMVFTSPLVVLALLAMLRHSLRLSLFLPRHPESVANRACSPMVTPPRNNVAFAFRLHARSSSLPPNRRW